jgi:hypothetical protein
MSCKSGFDEVYQTFARVPQYRRRLPHLISEAAAATDILLSFTEPENEPA